MEFIGKIDIEKYKVITADIKTDEVVITGERREHIRLEHPGDYELMAPHFESALATPDYIFEDENHPGNTGLILKRIEKGNLRFRMVLRLHTSSDPGGYKNSILSAWVISESRWKNYVDNKKILYRFE